MIGPGVLVMVGYPSVASVWNWSFWNWNPSLSLAIALRFWVILVTVVMVFAVSPMLRGANQRALGRLARMELGTHCVACDYDLRATGDRTGPRVGRCWEWGGG